MKMIKILQIAVVAMFVLMVAAGVGVLAAAPERMDTYLSLVGGLFPIFLAQVVPALIGSPLTDFIRAKAAALAPPQPLPEGPAVEESKGTVVSPSAIPPPAGSA